MAMRMEMEMGMSMAHLRERVIEATRESDGRLVSCLGIPADDCQVGQLALDVGAERHECVAAVEVDALKVRANVATQQRDEMLRVGQLELPVGELKCEGSGKSAAAARIPVTRELEDARRELSYDLDDQCNQ